MESSRGANGPVLPLTTSYQLSASPSGGFRVTLASDMAPAFDLPSPFASSTSSSFASSQSSSRYLQRASSPTRVNLHGLASASSPSVRISIGRSASPSRSMAASPRHQAVREQNATNPLAIQKKKTCMCSPTNHPGSFRCSLHKNCNNNQSMSYSSNRLNARRSAMTNSLVRIGVEGDLVKRALASLIRPSSHQQRRRAAFEPRPSRLSAMSKAEDI